MAGRCVSITKCSGQVTARSSVIGDKCASSYPMNDRRHIDKITWPNHKLLESSVNLRSSIRAPYTSPMSRDILTLKESFTLGVVVVVIVVCFPWFYFHGKGIVNANHNHNHLFAPSTSLLHMVSHTLGGCSCLMWHH